MKRMSMLTRKKSILRTMLTRRKRILMVMVRRLSALKIRLRQRKPKIAKEISASTIKSFTKSLDRVLYLLRFCNKI